MAIGCGAKCAKFFLFAFNIVFWLSGAALIIVGAIYASNKEIKMLENVMESDSSLTNVAYALIVLGCIIFVVGFCGCCGAIRESQCLLGFYIFFLVVIMAAELAIGIFIAIKKGKVESGLEEKLTKDMMQKYGLVDSKKVTDYIDTMQAELKCCGINSTNDWRDTVWKKEPSNAQKNFPKSCCKKSDQANCETTSNSFKNGCLQKIKETVRSKFPIIIGVACAIALLEILGVVLAILLCCNRGEDI